MSGTKAKLYIVASPIGNLADITFRAVEVLQQCTVIAAEDTRQTRLLLDRYSLTTPMVTLHEHNESTVASGLIKRIKEGDSVALVSDAGTPLINDPGFRLVHEAKESGVVVVPVPGPCAVITALSVSSLPTDRFSFEGFPPRTGAARRAYFSKLAKVDGTVIFYESCHRVLASLCDLATVFEPERVLVIARELTKIHETIVKTTVSNAPKLIAETPYMQKGEFVILAQGAAQNETQQILDPEHERLLQIVMEECSLKTAATIVAKMTGMSKRLVYNAALRMEQS